MPTSIAIFATGGTFDKIYDPLTGALVFGQTCAPALLEAGRCQGLARVRTLMLKDSLEMTDADRRKILAACGKAKEKRIVVIHGTDTMVETARVLAESAGASLAGKTVVLTGAMVPHALCGSSVGSDAAFNFGAAVAFAQALPAGVHVAMNGRVFAWDKVEKNKKRGRFEAR